MEESDDLVLDSRDIADPAIVQTVRTIEKTGQDQYDNYMTERVVERPRPYLKLSAETICLYSADNQ